MNSADDSFHSFLAYYIDTICAQLFGTVWNSAELTRA